MSKTLAIPSVMEGFANKRPDLLNSNVLMSTLCHKWRRSCLDFFGAAAPGKSGPGNSAQNNRDNTQKKQDTGDDAFGQKRIRIPTASGARKKRKSGNWVHPTTSFLPPQIVVEKSVEGKFKYTSYLERGGGVMKIFDL